MGTSSVVRYLENTPMNASEHSSLPTWMTDPSNLWNIKGEAPGEALG